MQKENANLLIHQIQVSHFRRTNLDIQKWRDAITYAENPYQARRTQLMDLYKDMMLDTHLSGIVSRRKNTILNTAIHAGKDGEDNETITNMFARPEALRFCDDILDTLFYGHTLVEFDFTNDNFHAHLLPRRNVDPLRKMLVPDIGNFEDGILYNAPEYEKSVIEIIAPDPLGILSKSAPMVIYKRNTLGDFAQYGEIFGQPIRKITYDPADPTAYQEALKSVEQTGGAAVVILPKETNIDFIESANKSGSVDVFTKLIETANAEMSKLILGNTLTTQQGDKGTQALGTVHQNSEEQIILYDRIFLLNVLNYQVKPLLIANGFKMKEDEIFYFAESEELDLTKRITIDMQLAGSINIGENYFYETYNIPRPAKGETIAKANTGNLFGGGALNGFNEDKKDNKDEDDNEDKNKKYEDEGEDKNVKSKKKKTKKSNNEDEEKTKLKALQWIKDFFE